MGFVGRCGSQHCTFAGGVRGPTQGRLKEGGLTGQRALMEVKCERRAECNRAMSAEWEWDVGLTNSMASLTPWLLWSDSSKGHKGAGGRGLTPHSHRGLTHFICGVTHQLIVYMATSATIITSHMLRAMAANWQGTKVEISFCKCLDKNLH